METVYNQCMTETKKRYPIIEISEEARANLKVIAARRGKTMRQLVEEIVRREFAETFPADLPYLSVAPK